MYVKIIANFKAGKSKQCKSILILEEDKVIAFIILPSFEYVSEEYWQFQKVGKVNYLKIKVI